MTAKAKNNLIFGIEFGFFGLCCLMFLICKIFFQIPPLWANVIYIAFMLIAFGWVFSCEFIFKNMDYAMHYKMKAKHYVASPKVEKRTNYKRKGLGFVILSWIGYLLVVFVVKLLGFLTWEIVSFFVSALFMLNSFFLRKICLFRKWFMKNNCCANCGINCWDYPIFASPLIFAPFMSIAATVVNAVIFVFCFVMFFIWEHTYKKHPYRFYTDTNMAIGCKDCLKRCHTKKQLAYTENKIEKVKAE